MTWQVRKISDLGRVVTGKTPLTSNREFFDGDYLFVTPTDIDYGHYYCRATEKTVTELARERHLNQFIPRDAVIFTCIGNTIGKCALAPDDCLTNQQMNSVIVNESTDAKFVYYLLLSNVDSIRRLGGGAATPIINKTTFENIELSVPETDEQRRIGALLSTYDDLIENNQSRMALLEEAARLLYQEWFVYLRFPGHEHTTITNGIPEGWHDWSVSDFGHVVTGKTPSTKVQDNYGESVPFIKTPDMHGNVFVLKTETSLTEKGANTQPGKFIPANTLLVSCIGTIGVVSLTSERSQFNQQINAVIPFDDSYRYYCFFAFNDLKEQMEAIGGGATMGNVNKSKFKSLKVIKPITSLLREFNDMCDPMFQQILVLSRQNENLRSARDLLLPRLMSGEIEV